LVAQLLIILLLDKPWSSGYTRLAAGSEEETQLFPEFDQKRATAFQVKRGEQQIEFKRVAEDEWVILADGKEYGADERWIDILFHSLEEAKRSNIETENPENWQHYHVDAEQGFLLQVWDDQQKAIVDVVVGKNLGPLKGTYVRESGQDGVMHIMENIRRCVNRGPDWVRAWRDKVVFRGRRTDRLTFMQIDGPHGRIFLKAELGMLREDDKWIMMEPGQGEVTDQMKALTGALNAVHAQAFYGSEVSLADLGLDPPQLTITLGRLDQDPVVFKMSDLGEGRNRGFRALWISTKPEEAFKVPGASFNVFAAKPETFFRKKRGGG
jgi:hypothetical protein